MPLLYVVIVIKWILLIRKQDGKKRKKKIECLLALGSSLLCLYQMKAEPFLWKIEVELPRVIILQDFNLIILTFSSIEILIQHEQREKKNKIDW